MGQGGICKCVEDEGSSSASLDVTSVPVLQDQVKGAKAIFMGGVLEGPWLRKGDNVFLGTIKESKMTWVPGFNHPPCDLSEADSMRVSIFLEGKMHSGVISKSGGETSICWSDGEVWYKKAD